MMVPQGYSKCSKHNKVYPDHWACCPDCADEALARQEELRAEYVAENPPEPQRDDQYEAPYEPDD